MFYAEVASTGLSLVVTIFERRLFALAVDVEAHECERRVFANMLPVV